MAFRELKKLIADRAAHIAVIGLGTVGLPLAATFAEVGFRVCGVDINEQLVDDVNASRVGGEEPGLAALVARAVGSGRLTAHAGYEHALSQSQVAIVCVPTPVKDGIPSYMALLRALTGISIHMPEGGLVIVESTLSPGTMRCVVEPATRALSPYLAHCPERISPGGVIHCLWQNDRVIGGVTPQAAKLATTLYGAFLLRTRMHSTDATTAEFTKCAENAYRDVQIALANEFSDLCEDLSIDFWQARDLINTSPGRDLLRAGPGVGGICLPKDSHLLVNGASVLAPLIMGARKINEARHLRMSYHVRRAFAAGHVVEIDPCCTILGLTYKPNTALVCNSPSHDLMTELGRGKLILRWHDPYFVENSLVGALRGSDCAVLMVAHDAYRDLDWQELGAVMRHKVLVDATGTIWPPPEGFTFRGIGRVGDG